MRRIARAAAIAAAALSIALPAAHAALAPDLYSPTGGLVLPAGAARPTDGAVASDGSTVALLAGPTMSPTVWIGHAADGALPGTVELPDARCSGAGTSCAPLPGLAGTVRILAPGDARHVLLLSTDGGIRSLTRGDDGSLTPDAAPAGCAAPGGTGGCVALPAPADAEPFHLLSSPDGLRVVLALQGTGGAVLEVLRRDPGTGALSAGGCLASVDVAGCTTLPLLASLIDVAASDVSLVAVTGPAGDRTLLDVPLGADGALDAAATRCYAPTARDGCAAVARGLAPASAVAVSADGATVALAGPYVAALLRRDAGGSLEPSAAAGCIDGYGECAYLGLPDRPLEAAFVADGALLAVAGAGPRSVLLRVRPDTLEIGATATLPAPTRGSLLGGRYLLGIDRQGQRHGLWVSQQPPTCGATPLDVHIGRRTWVPCGDPNGDPITAIRATGPVPAGRIDGKEYVAPADRVGLVEVPMQASDGVAFGPAATVVFRVTDTAPRCAALSLVAYRGGTTLVTPRCTDVDGDALTVTATGDARAAAAARGGAVAVTGTRVGAASVVVHASDGALAGDGAATVKVLAPPRLTGVRPRGTALAGDVVRAGTIAGRPAWVRYGTRPIELEAATDALDRKSLAWRIGLKRAVDRRERAVAAFSYLRGSRVRLQWGNDENSVVRLLAHRDAVVGGPPGVPDVASARIVLLAACDLDLDGFVRGGVATVQGRLDCPRAGRAGSGRVERLSGKRWLRVARVSVGRASNHYSARFPATPGVYRVVYVPRDARRVLPTQIGFSISGSTRAGGARATGPRLVPGRRVALLP